MISNRRTRVGLLAVVAFGIGLAGIGRAEARPEARDKQPAAAQYQHPGCSVTVYWDADFKGASWTTTDGWQYIGDEWNNEISAIVVNAGEWQFFKDPDFRGRSETLEPGSYAYVGSEWDDQISSFRCIKSP
jgi:hypothetical protein